MIGYQLSIQAARHPDAIALVYGAQRLTYSQLHARTCRLANALSSAGVVPGERVAVLLHNCTAVIEALFACALIGAVFVPINFRLVSREIALVLEASSPRLLLAGGGFAAVLAQLGDGVSLPDTRWVDDELPAGSAPVDAYTRWCNDYSPHCPQVVVAPDALLMLLHSSGTTGLPKGIIFSHATTLASSSAKIIDFGLTPQDATVVFGPLFHAGPLMDLTLPLLLHGGRVVLGASRHFEPQHLLRTIAEERGTVIPIYPTMLRRVLDTETDPGLDLGSLRLIVTGGEAAPVPVIRGVHARFPGVAFVNNYGSTDGGPVTTFLAPEYSLHKMGSVGKEAFSVQVRIVDEQGQVQPPDEVGELIVRSPFVCLGYWNRADMTAAQLRDGWWHTGDLAYRDADGFIWIAGRSKDLIKSGTENIYPIEVEQVIAAIDGVVEVAVFGVPDAEWGETVAAFVVVKSGVAMMADDVVGHCRVHMASYKKPHHVLFVDTLPRGTTNKVDKRKLRRWWEAGGRNIV